MPDSVRPEPTRFYGMAKGFVPDQLATRQKMRALTVVAPSRAMRRYLKGATAIAAMMVRRCSTGCATRQSTSRRLGASGQQVRSARHGPLGLSARRGVRHPAVKPADNSFIGVFGRCCTECLNQHGFLTPSDAAHRRGGDSTPSNGTLRSATRPDEADEIRGHHQPVTLIEAEKLCLRTVRR